MGREMRCGLLRLSPELRQPARSPPPRSPSGVRLPAAIGTICAGQGRRTVLRRAICVATGANRPGLLVRALVSRPLYERKLRLPDFAQYAPAADLFLQPDFYYQRGAIPGVCVFIDGPPHAGQEAQDRRAREPLEDRGYRIVVITANRPLAEQIDAFPDIFVPLANGHS